MAKQQDSQKFVFKIHSTRLRKSRWNLNLSVQEAMKNKEIIPLAGSTVLRFIDELNMVKDAECQIKELKKRIKEIKRKDDAYRYKRQLKALYEQINLIQFKPDYLCLIIDKESDYWRAFEKGFKLNGVKYSRLLGTTGGIKNATIIFTSERLKPELRKRLENGRNMEQAFVPAKYGAYEALSCTASTPVSFPSGVLVVNDVETKIKETVLEIDDSSDNPEPVMTLIKDKEIIKNATDGFGIVSPERMEIWSKELELDYLPSGVNTRYCFEKGMLVTMDFQAYVDEYADGNYIVKDAWGYDVDIRTIDVILTTSMLKLWDAYESWDHYKKNCDENGYKFCIAKVTPKVLDNERNLNYQFIQSYEFTDEQIQELIQPTIDLFHDLLGGDYRKTLLFLKGENINDDNVLIGKSDFVKALMIDKRMTDDPFVRGCIFKMLKRKINQAKTGVIRCSGNYQIACGDPVILMQSILGLEQTGLLGTGEFYSKYWIDKDVDEIVTFRAPMTCHNNIRRMKMKANEDTLKWYKYIDTMLIFNSWDSTAEAENGEDFDADQNFTTDNKLLLENHRVLPTIMCVQRKAAKKVFTEEDLVQSDIQSFGDEIGMYTNGITAQFDIQSLFDKDSIEYKILEYRIMCGQLFQQNAIDKAKGIIAKPRPANWFDLKKNKINEDDTEEEKARKTLYKSLVADKKPYFMRYIYPNLMSKYNKYVKDSNKKCQIEFKMSIADLYEKQDKTQEEIDFLKYYEMRTPVSNNNCVVNKICRIFEREFDGYISRFKVSNTPFDYSILKSDVKITVANKKKIEMIYKQYCRLVAKFQQSILKERIDEETLMNEKKTMVEQFKQECSLACPNEKELCNIVLDLCYSSNVSKSFAWDICGDVIIDNLLENNNYTINYPVSDENGDILFNGHSFTMKKQYLGGFTND